MSCHFVEHEKYLISFGWDRPMNTFFAKVEDTTKSSDETPLLDIGDVFEPYGDMTAFKKALAAHLHELGIPDFALSADQEIQLFSDRDGIS